MTLINDDRFMVDKDGHVLNGENNPPVASPVASDTSNLESPYGVDANGNKTNNVPDPVVTDAPKVESPYGVDANGNKTANIDGYEFLLLNGKPVLLSDEQAIQRYKDTGEYFGKFSNVEEANKYAEALHNQQEQSYLGTIPNKGGLNKVKAATAANPSPWEKGFREGMKNNPDMTFAEGVSAYNQWAKANGKDPLDIWEMQGVIGDRDPYKTAEQNEVDERKARNKERWDQVGNFLTHLGNFVGTLHGGISQNIEPASELTKRQQELRDKTLALRKAATKDYYQAYKDQQNARIAKEKNERTAAIQERRLDQADARLFLERDKFEWKKKMDEGTLDLKKAKQELDRQVRLGLLSQGAARLVLQDLELRLKQGGTETTQEITDENDNKKVIVTKTKPADTGQGGDGGGQGNGRRILDNVNWIQ